MIKVLIAGAFDIIHPGHLHFIKQAKIQGDFLTIIVARDQSILKSKGRLPYYNENQRLGQLKKLKLADKVRLGNLGDHFEAVRQERPDIICLGYDQTNFFTDKIKAENLKIEVKLLESFKSDIFQSRRLRKAFEDPQAGFLLVNKDSGWTSHDVVAKLRSITKIRQIGHSGTLDPFATGLMVCGLGSATKMLGMTDILVKTYQAVVRLGAVSDTYDRTGEVKELKTEINISLKQLKAVLDNFVGRQEQLPPMYSAKKVQGKKLYDLARQGKEVERKSSQIEIYGFDKVKAEDDLVNFEVKCSSGTYIRTLANDLGQALGTGALLQELKRIQIGNFKLKQAHKMSLLTKSNYRKYLISPEKVLQTLVSFARLNEIVGRG